MLGRVKNFDNKKGYGFIISDEVEGDIFIHYSQIKQEGFKYLFIGDKIEFELVETEKGYQAKNVIKKED